MRPTSARRGILRTFSTHYDSAGGVADEIAESCPKLLTLPPAEKNGLIEIVAAEGVGFQSLGQMLGHTNRIGHCSKCGVHRPDAHEKAGVDHIQIVELMSLAVDIEN